MPQSNQERAERQDAIRRLLADGPAATQQAIVDTLMRLGLDATQSSVSRDLREIGAIKTAHGYELATPVEDGEAEIGKVGNLVRSLAPAGPNLLVIRTAIGAAQRVALALDRAGFPEIVGNVGGDDTVFTATRDQSGQRSLIMRIRRAAANG